MTEASFNPESLLRHAGALRALARAIVRDAHAADDLVQTTWLRALRARPAAAGPAAAGPGGQGLWPWLSRVLRNEAHFVRRSARRAAAREQRVGGDLARDGAAPAADDVAARLAVQRTVLDAVQALPPAQRDVVYLRWFDGLPPRAIAQRLGLSSRAVESRLRRALEQLREQLDARHDGDRAGWLGALCAVAWSRSSWVSFLAGAVAVHSKSAIAVLALGIGALYWIWPEGALAPPAPAALAGAAAGEPAVADSPVAAAADAAAGTNAPADRVALAPVPVPAPAAPDAAAPRVRGRVLDVERRPVAGATVRFVPAERVEASIASRGFALPAAVVSAADGAFELIDPRCEGTIECREPGWTTVLAAEPSHDDETVVVVVARPRTLAGTVRLPDGTPIEGAAVELLLPDDARARFDVSLQHSVARTWRGQTDALGRFAFAAPPRLPGCAVTARAQGYNDLDHAIDDGDHTDLQLVLRPVVAGAGQLRGVVLDASGRPVEGATVALGRLPATTGADGAFDFVLGSAEREQRLFAVAAGWRPVVLERAAQPGDKWPDYVELHLIDRPLAITGVVRTAAGAPHANAAVWVGDPTYFAQKDEFSLSAEHQMVPGELVWRRFDTDADGRFRIEGLLDRRYEVCGIEKGTADMVVVPDVAAGSADVVLQFAGDGMLETLQGRIVDGAGAPVAGINLWVERYAFRFGAPEAQQFLCQERGARAMTAEDGTFTLRGVPRRGISLRLGGRDLITDAYEFPGDVVTSPIEIVVSRRCGIRIDVSGSRLAEAEFARVLDARGEGLRIQRESAGTRYIERRTALVGGRTEVVYVADTARSVVLMRGDEELGRLPVLPDPAGIAVVRP